MTPLESALRRPRVHIVTPAAAEANNGNVRTAERWAAFLAPHADVTIAVAWPDLVAPVARPATALRCDALIALHALRSAASIERFVAAQGSRRLAVVLTGTDLYRDLAGGDEAALHAIECARFVVTLQAPALATLAALPGAGARAAAARGRVIVQSASALHLHHRAHDADFVAVGHLRAVKDPATLMAAAQLLARGAPHVRVAQIGDALDDDLAEQARATMAACASYRWRGALPHASARRAIARARALVHPSRVEGGANAVIEAVRSGVPVLASRIDGNTGLLGDDYAGYFPAGDAPALAALMSRFLAEPAFAEHLRAQCDARAPLFRPAAERRAVRHLLADMLTE